MVVETKGLRTGEVNTLKFNERVHKIEGYCERVEN